MIVQQFTSGSHGEPKEPAALKERLRVRMRFSHLAAMLSDDDWATGCAMIFHWKERMVEFKFKHEDIQWKNIRVVVGMNSEDEEIFESFAIAQGKIEELLNGLEKQD